MNDLEVRWVPVGDITPFLKNARKIPRSAVDKVGLSLRTYGWRQPIVVDRHFVIIVGHVRRLAAIQEGLTQVPIHVAENLTPAQVKAYRLMDNRSHNETDWDLDLLGSELAELRDLEFDLSLPGFDTREI